ncbi:Ubiquilin-3, partial [Coelomomyces lativittatus]
MPTNMLTDHPDILRGFMMMDPRLRQLSESNPEIGQLLSDPSFMRQIIQMSRNPNALREIQRNQDRALANIEMLPGGFNALQRMYHTLSPLDAALPTDLHDEEANNRRLAEQLHVHSPPPQSLNVDPLPNPWSNDHVLAHKYAKQLNLLVDMGFDRRRALKALESAHGNVDVA